MSDRNQMIDSKLSVFDQVVHESFDINKVSEKRKYNRQNRQMTINFIEIQSEYYSCFKEKIDHSRRFVKNHRIFILIVVQL